MRAHQVINILLTIIVSNQHLLWSAETDTSRLTIDRIYAGGEFETKSSSARWLENESKYTTLESSKSHEGYRDIVLHDPATGESKLMVSADEMVPPDVSRPLSLQGYTFSNDLSKLLIYTNSKRVWRQNTRGDYWVLDRSSGQLVKLGGDAQPSTLMFAKFAPDGQQVAYVRDRNIYVEDLLDRSIKQLTQTSSEHVINGTADWVYEEEFGLRDGFRWSPDGQSIAYWQIDTTDVQQFPLVNNIDSLYPTVQWFAYPKVGQRNPVCRVGVVNVTIPNTTWIKVPGDPRNHYIPKMQWTTNSDQLLLQQLNRLQNTNRLFLANGNSGEVELIHTEQDAAWLDVNDELFWLNKGANFTWMSEKTGWRHIYVISNEGKTARQVTSGDFDVIRLRSVDEEEEQFYFIASPDDASQRFLYRVNFNGNGLTRLTPMDQAGTHDYKLSSDAQWAIHTFSDADTPPQTELINLSDQSTVRVLEDNSALKKKLAELERHPTEFFQIDIGDDIMLDAYCIKPPDFNPKHLYPLLIYVYGEPAGTTVVNRWQGKSYLWHTMLAQEGYIVMSIDNRGTKAPKGRAWRKSIYRKIGIIAPREQAAAVKVLLKERPYLDPTRVGIWGWSGGGSSSLQAVFKYPDIYRTAIAIAPVPNQRYYDTIYQERYMGLPETNVEGFLQGSPINFAKNLEGDLLLVHGTADDNCHIQTTELLIDELIAHNKQFNLMIYPNRTHSIRERENTTRHLRQLMTDFLMRTLPLEE